MPGHEQVSSTHNNELLGVYQCPPSHADLFNGTVISNEAEEENCVLDVEGDSSEVYGPSQYPTPTATCQQEGRIVMQLADSLHMVLVEWLSS